MSMLYSLGRDWLRAPISGTAMIAALVGAGLASWRGDEHLALLWVIFGQVVGLGRGRLRPVDRDPFMRQAREDQDEADYPGCELGLMECRSQTCDCNEDRPCEAFVIARAALLKREAAELRS